MKTPVFDASAELGARRPRAQDIDCHIGARLRQLRIMNGLTQQIAGRSDRRDVPAGAQVRNWREQDRRSKTLYDCASAWRGCRLLLRRSAEIRAKFADPTTANLLGSGAQLQKYSGTEAPRSDLSDHAHAGQPTDKCCRC